MDLIFRKMEINSLMFASAAAPPDCRCYNRIYWFIFINNTPEFLKVCFEDIIVSAADVSSFCRTAVKERDPKPISLLRKWVWMARLHYFGVMCKKNKISWFIDMNVNENLWRKVSFTKTAAGSNISCCWSHMFLDLYPIFKTKEHTVHFETSLNPVALIAVIHLVFFFNEAW